VWRHIATAGTPMATWPGFTRRAFTRWGRFFAYGAPAAAMICCEWWVGQIKEQVDRPSSVGQLVILANSLTTLLNDRLLSWLCTRWVFELVILMAGSLPNADVGVAVMGITFRE
jgi:hypothetical protein